MDYEPLRRFCQELCDCDGTVFFNGVGKSGFIANKISQTLVSTGTKSVYLNPTDALHGDIGIVGPSDILVLFSKSGASSELLSLIPYARAKGAKLVAVTSNAKSALAGVRRTRPPPARARTLPLRPRPGDQYRHTDALWGHVRGGGDAREGSFRGGVRDESSAVRDGKRLILNVCDVMRPLEVYPRARRRTRCLRR